MEEITLKFFINAFKKGRDKLVEKRLNTPFWKIEAWLFLKKEIKRVDTIIYAGERYLRHQVHQK